MKTHAEWNGFKLYWGILHCHIAGEYCHDQELFTPRKLAETGAQIDSLYKFAREDMEFDFIAYADHHNMGQMIKLGTEAASPWNMVSGKADLYNEDGRFATLKGYEFQDGREYNVYLCNSTHLPLADKWEELIAQVEPNDESILLAAHYRPNPTDWSFPLHRRFRLIEIMNDGGAPFEDWANAGLNAGHHAGFIAGSDDHTCRPGQTVATGIWARELTRQGIWDGLCKRRCIAGIGRRPPVTFSLNDTPMGGCTASPPRRDFQVSYAHRDEPLTVILVRNGCAVAESRRPGAAFSVVMEDTTPADGMLEDYYYLKFIYADGGVVYTSPIWVRNPAGTTRAPVHKETEPQPPVHYHKDLDLGVRLGWHRFVNAGPIAAATPFMSTSKAVRDMVIHAGPDPVLATSAGTVIAPGMDGIHEFSLDGNSTVLRSFDGKADLTLLITGLVEADNSIFAAGYHGENIHLETLRGNGLIATAGLPVIRPYYFSNKLVTPQWLAGDGDFLYCLGERELFVMLPGGAALASCQAGYPAFPCAVAASGLSRVYVLSCDGALIAYDLTASQTGRVLWQAQVPAGCVSLAAHAGGVWAFNDRLIPCSISHDLYVWPFTDKGAAETGFSMELFNLRGSGLAWLSDRRLAGIHNPSRKASAIHREILNETGVLRILKA